MADLSNLNDEQFDALMDSLGPHDKTCVLAGAGSGKTRVITSRVSYLIDDQKVSPGSIVCMTFTNKAANEMKERMIDSGTDVDGLWIGTFHSICMRILRMYGKGIGINKFSTMDEADRFSLIKTIIDDSNLSIEPSEAKKIAARISSSKSLLINPSMARSTIKNNNDIIFCSIYEEYQSRTWSSKTFDFDDLIVYTKVLLERDASVRKKFNDRFKYIIVDEYQDTNGAQFELVKLMVGNNNLFVVGDDWQSIYGFRFAEPKYIIDFPKMYPGASIKKFQTNYRSTKVLVDAGNAIIGNNSKQVHKVMVPYGNKPGDKILFKRLTDQKEEASYIAGYIAHQLKSGIKPDEIAVLYRSNFMSRILETALANQGIGYMMIGGTSFYSRMEIKDIMSFLKVYSNRLDDISFKRALLTIPKLGEKTVSVLLESASKMNISGVDYLMDYCSNNSNKIVAATSVKIKDLFKRLDTCSVSEAISDIIQTLDYLKIIDASNKFSDTAKENLEELIVAAGEFEMTSYECSIHDFLSQVSLSTSSDKQCSGKVVRLMTNHGSKGLEFDSVICCGWTEGLFPHPRSVSQLDDIEEERRLAYVAVSRAKKHLLITSPENVQSFGAKKNNANSKKGSKNEKTNESRFIKHIPSHIIKSI